MNRAGDKPLELAIGHLLRLGVMLAAAITLAGGVMYLSGSHPATADYHTFTRESQQLTSIGGILHSALGGNALGIMQLGLLLLLATPVARVALALAGFAVERDWMYVLVSAIVLGVLIFSLAHAG